MGLSVEIEIVCGFAWQRFDMVYPCGIKTVRPLRFGITARPFVVLTETPSQWTQPLSLSWPPGKKVVDILMVSICNCKGTFWSWGFTIDDIMVFVWVVILGLVEVHTLHVGWFRISIVGSVKTEKQRVILKLHIRATRICGKV